jgi:hypothetical protein
VCLKNSKNWGAKRLIDKKRVSEHKHCDNAGTKGNSEIARSRMEASSARKLGYGAKED